MIPVAKHRRALAIALGSIVFLVALCTLPYRVPLAPVYSVSYVYGYNNRIGVLLTGCGLALLALFGPRLRLSFKAGKPLTASTLKKALAISGAGAVALDLLVRGLDGVFESIYLIDRAKLLHEGHVPYKDFEYAYGAAFLYGPSWIARLTHLSVEDGYGIVWIAGVLLGTYLLYKCLLWVELPGGAQRTVFLFFWACSLVNLLSFGVTYSSLRYALPCFFGLVILRRLQAANGNNVAVILLPVPMFALMMLISPELAISFAVGVSAFLLRFGHLRDRRNLGAFVASLALLAGGVYVADRCGVLYTMRAFSHGGLNLPLMPAPHLLLLFFLSGLAACHVGYRLREGQPDALTMLTAVSACSLVAALGTCDALHVLLNPMGVLIAGCLLVSGLPQIRWAVWPLLWFVFVFLRFTTIIADAGMQFEKTALPALLELTPAAYHARVADAVLAHMTRQLGPALAREKLNKLEASMASHSYDVPAMFHLPETTVLNAPFGFAPGGFGTFHSPAVDEGFYFENENVVTPDAVARKIHELRSHPERPLLLLPGRENACIIGMPAGKLKIGSPFFYPYRGKPVHNNDVTEPMCAFIRQNYHLAEAATPNTFDYALWLPNAAPTPKGVDPAAEPER